MLRPSYYELMETLNNNIDTKITSRYIVVMAVAKRARQLIKTNMESPDDSFKIEKALSIAVEDIYKGRIKIKN
jgi:DNA-directed RNA polymerase subunit omega